MDENLSVILFCLFLFLFTTLCGYLPVAMNTSPKILSIIAVIGGGLLISAALVVIIPEGVMTLIESMEGDKLDKAGVYIGASLIVGFGFILVIDQS